MKLFKLFSVIVALIAISSHAKGETTYYLNDGECGWYTLWFNNTTNDEIWSYMINIVSNRSSINVDPDFEIVTVFPGEYKETYYQITANGGGGQAEIFANGYLFDIINVVYLGEAPSAPKVDVNTVGTNHFVLDITSYEYYVDMLKITVSDKTGYQETEYINTNGVYNRTFTKYGLKEGETYNVSVTAIDKAGNESEESSISITTPRSIETPSGRKSSGSYETASLIWNTQLDATKYYIYAPNGALLATYSAPNPQAWVNTMNCTVRNLEPGKSYSGYYIVSENIMGMKSAGGYFPAFTTKKFEITGPDELCTKASYAIKDYNSSLFSVSKWSCSTSTVKATNGNGYSIELQKVANGDGWISFTLKSKSTQKEYTIRKDFSVGFYGAPSSVNVPTYNLYKGTTYSASVTGGSSKYTYTWNIAQSEITSGQGTRKISFIINGNDSNIPRRAANNQDEDFDNPRSTRKTALQPNPSTPTLPFMLSGSVRAHNSCGSKTLNFTITYMQSQNIRVQLDSVETIAIVEEVLSSIESESVPQENSFVVYPNPASSVINIRQPYDKESINTVDIFDATGRKCISEAFCNEDSFATVNIEALPKGTYILIINQNGNSQVGKFIKE